MLSAGLLDLVRYTDTDQSEVGLELLEGLGGVVHKGETSGLATTVLCLEAENVNLVLCGLVHLGEFATELLLGDVGAVGVEDITAQALASILILTPQHFRLHHPAHVPENSSTRVFETLIGHTYMTICLRPRRGLRMNLRVRSVTAWDSDDMLAVEESINPRVCRM